VSFRRSILVLACSAALLVTLCLVTSPWSKAPDPSKLIGRSYDQVSAAMGTPDTQTRDYWSYNSLTRQTTIEFTHGQVTRIQLCNHPCSDGRCYSNSTTVTITSLSQQ